MKYLKKYNENQEQQDPTFAITKIKEEYPVSKVKEMLEKEKYSTDKDKNKMTYIRIPANHPKYPFPYNLEDRIKYLIGKIRTEIKHTIDITVTKGSVKSGINKGKPFYSIVIKKNPKLTEYLEAAGYSTRVYHGKRFPQITNLEAGQDAIYGKLMADVARVGVDGGRAVGDDALVGVDEGGVG